MRVVTQPIESQRRGCIALGPFPLSRTSGKCRSIRHFSGKIAMRNGSSFRRVNDPSVTKVFDPSVLHEVRIVWWSLPSHPLNKVVKFESATYRQKREIPC
jgi:hypothetical protein